MSDTRRIPTFCGMCGPSAGCGIYAHVKDGRFIRIEGMKESPLNRGRNCAKAHAALQWVYSPDRLMHPLRRVGEKGEGRFERITWDQALDTIADKLKEQKEKYGPESLAILSPARRSYSDYLYRFLMAHGSPNYCHSGICAMQNGFSFAYTLGHPWPLPVADYPEQPAHPHLGQAAGLFRRQQGQHEDARGGEGAGRKDHRDQTLPGAGCGPGRHVGPDAARDGCRPGPGHAPCDRQGKPLRCGLRLPVVLRLRRVERAHPEIPSRLGRAHHRGPGGPDPELARLYATTRPPRSIPGTASSTPLPQATLPGPSPS